MLHEWMQHALPLTNMPGKLVKIHRNWDRLLRFLISNEQFLLRASHPLALISFLPLQARARLPMEWSGEFFSLLAKGACDQHNCVSSISA